LAFGFWLVLVLAGCASPQSRSAGSRPFDFDRDTFSYANELVWEYYFDENGKWTHRERLPKPDYTHRCFVVARSAKQFFVNARFDTNQPVADAETYRHLVREVQSVSARKELPEDRKIVIPGYAGLREFSRSQEAVLKAECGGFWQSYLQRGHWRMILPFSRSGQEKMAERLRESVGKNRPAVVHVVAFPSLRINHAVVVFDVAETETALQFATYDPNAPEKPVTLTFDRASRTFTLPTNLYFPGGELDVYEIYSSWCY